MRLRTRAGLLALISLIAVAVPAVAATPDKGTVSKASPSLKWEGTATGYGVFPTDLLLTTAGQEPAPCNAPYCDTFTLTVADKDDLNLVAQQRAGGNFTEIRVVKPDGSKLFVQSAQGEAAKLKIKGAAPGDYTIEVMTNEDVSGSGAYDASATLGSGAAPAPAPAPAGGPTTAPAPAPAAAPAPGAADRPAATLGLTTRSASAKKVKKALKLVVTASSPVTEVQLLLAKGKKAIATGKLASLSGKGTLKLKLKRKLKPGTYRVGITAKDGARTVGLASTLKIKR